MRRGISFRHGAQLLAAADAICGERCSAYPTYALEGRLAGGESRIPVAEAISDGNLMNDLRKVEETHLKFLRDI